MTGMTPQPATNNAAGEVPTARVNNKAKRGPLRTGFCPVHNGRSSKIFAGVVLNGWAFVCGGPDGHYFVNRPPAEDSP